MFHVGEVKLIHWQQNKGSLVELLEDIPGLFWGKGVQVWLRIGEGSLQLYCCPPGTKGYLCLPRERLRELGMEPPVKKAKTLAEILDDGSPMDSMWVERL